MPGIVTAVESGASITSIKYQPKSKLQLHRPQAPSVTCGDSSRPSGAMGFCLFTLACAFGEVPTVNPSVKNQRFLPAPFHKGACGQCPQPFSHDSFLRIVTSLTRPVSLLRCSRCVDQSPPCQRGVPRHRRGGGIPQVGRFPHRFILSESACCRIPQSKIKDFCQLPFTREPFGLS